MFPNGSLILPLPGKPESMRGFTAHLLIIDEAAFVPDEVYEAATPMLTATNGDLWLLSTPRGKRGFFYEEWAGKDSATYPWFRMEGRPRRTNEWLAPFWRMSGGRRPGLRSMPSECQFTTPERNVFWTSGWTAFSAPTFRHSTSYRGSTYSS